MPQAPKSYFLSSLSPAARDLIVSRATAVSLPVKAVLYDTDAPPAYAFFMTSGIASVVSSMDDGNAVEVGMIGREGVAGSLQLLGPALPPTECFMQLEGTALRMPFDGLQEIFRTSEEIRSAILRRIQIDTMVLSQIAACHRLHEAEERLTRWLLMARDRTDSDTLDFTQEFLAEMLGTRRATVTMVAGALQRAGLIDYQRGRVHIVDRGHLEAAACDCYRIIKQLNGLPQAPAPN